ncbi:MAG: small multi-drug export protein [Candidatus Methanoperedens sp.]|nr:small multi-drug export protein [Candidatus Methanoperedens sp.]
MDFVKICLVALASMSPVGEEIIAIPAGVAMGLPVFIVAAVAAAANFLPVPVISFVFYQGNKYPRIRGWLLRRRNEKVKRWMDKYGIAGIFLLTPWVGVYAATITCELLCMQRARIYIAVAASLVFYAVVMALVITLGIQLI